MFVLATLITTIFGNPAGRHSQSDLPQHPTCNRGQDKLNVVFVMDSSGSLSDENYKNQRRTAHTLLEGFAAAYQRSHEDIHVGVLAFSGPGQLKVERPISLGWHHAFGGEWNLKRFSGGGTLFGPAIRLAERDLQAHTDAGNTGLNLIVLLTDGMPQDCGGEEAPGINEAKKCKAKYPIMTIFINNNAQDAYWNNVASRTRERTLVALSPCDVLHEGNSGSPRDRRRNNSRSPRDRRRNNSRSPRDRRSDSGESHATYQNGRKCSYYVAATGPDAYGKVTRAAAMLAESTLHTLDPRNTCEKNQHVVDNKCIFCDGQPAGDDRCGDNTVCRPRPPVEGVPASMPTMPPPERPEGTQEEPSKDPQEEPSEDPQPKAPEDGSSEDPQEEPSKEPQEEPSEETQPTAPEETQPTAPEETQPKAPETNGAPPTPSNSSDPPKTLPPGTSEAASAESDDSENGNMGLIIGAALAALALTSCVICCFCFVKHKKNKPSNHEFAEDEQHRIEPLSGVPNSSSLTESDDLRNQSTIGFIPPPADAREARSSRKKHARRTQSSDASKARKSSRKSRGARIPLE